MILQIWTRTASLIMACCITFAQECKSQNLVPNPSFEDYNLCPVSSGEINYSPTNTQFQTVKSWINPLEMSTPDYYNACALSPIFIVPSVGVPENFLGSQSARTGVAYVGIYAYSSSWDFNYSEYVECKLLQPLVAGHKYDVTFYVSYSYNQASVGQSSNTNAVAINRIGAHFSDTVLYHPGYASGKQVLIVPFHIEYSGTYIDDTINWVKVTGVYTARGGEQYLTIGTFNDGNSVNKKHVYPSAPVVGPNVSDKAYYFIDDVSVTEQDICDTIITLHDTVTCKREPFSISLSPGNNATSYLWNTGVTTPELFIINEGLYWRRALKGCDLYLDTFRVRSVKNKRTIEKTIVVCNTAEVILKGASGHSLYLWNTGDTTKDITVHHEGTFSCKSISNCEETTEIFQVKQKTFTLALELGNDTIICREDPFTIGKQLDNVRYTWNTGETTCCIRPAVSGMYILTISDGCHSFSDSITIDAIQCDGCIVVPNAFTPNSDGINDRFSVIPICPIRKYNLKIFNRWGELVFESVNPDNKWDGTYKGQTMPLGTYFYFIRYSLFVDKRLKILKGDITLIR